MNEKAHGFIQLIFVIAFIFVSFVISGLLQSEKPKPQGEDKRENRTLFVETQTVSPAPHQITFTTTGNISARATVDITPQISGNIINISDQMFAGGTFKANDVLFEIDPRDYKNEMQRLQAEVSSAATALELEKAEGAAALEEWRLLKGNESAPELVARTPQMEEARARLNAARAQLQTARLNLKRTEYSLPFDGRILSSSLELGQFVSAGQSYASAYDINTLEITTQLKDQQLQWLLKAEDPKITVTTTYLGEEKTYEANVKRTNAAISTQTRFAEVAFDFIEPPQDITSGLFAQISIEGQTLNGISVLPASALQKNGTIWVVDSDNKLQSITPDIVFNDETVIAFKGTGTLNAVISRLSGASEGTSVQTQDDVPPSQDEDAGE